MEEQWNWNNGTMEQWNNGKMEEWNLTNGTGTI